MTLKLYNITDDKRKVSKTLGTATTMTGDLIDDCSILDPVIEIDSASNINYNYAYIQEFNRYYFIKNADTTYDGMCRLYMHVDVLMSNKTQLLATTMIAKRQENLINHYLNDNEIPCNAYRNTTTHTFSEGLSFRDPLQQTPFVLVVAGGEPAS